MNSSALASWLLAQEARALRTRVAQVKPFALQETMLPAAALSTEAQVGIERFLADGRRELNRVVRDYVSWLESPMGRHASPVKKQRGFTLVRLRFNILLSQFDIFSDVITQRSEHDTGVHLAGLDVLADDALHMPGGYFDPPPVICYLDRGHGAAIRRARTRLPGGGDNPVAIIRVPRERMVGSGIGSSLVHEVGHQGAALLQLIPSLQVALKKAAERAGPDVMAWNMWSRWISEIVADFWSVSRLGISSTLGLLSVVSLPRVFVFRVSVDDPHPFPWIRVKLSCAIGKALYPHPQWDKLSQLWSEFYPPFGLGDDQGRLLRVLQATTSEFVDLLLSHKPASLRGAALADVMAVHERTPARLASLYEEWRTNPESIENVSPSLAFAAIGQARANGRVTPEQEGRTIRRLLTHWALRRVLDGSERCIARPLDSLRRRAS